MKRGAITARLLREIRAQTTICLCSEIEIRIPSNTCSKSRKTFRILSLSRRSLFYIILGLSLSLSLSFSDEAKKQIPREKAKIKRRRSWSLIKFPRNCLLSLSLSLSAAQFFSEMEGIEKKQ
jgi:hypothetical protein